MLDQWFAHCLIVGRPDSERNDNKWYRKQWMAFSPFVILDEKQCVSLFLVNKSVCILSITLTSLSHENFKV